ncbi:MAG: alpha/beta fold hydrolase [Thermoleophilaceae bacterium]
MPRSSSPFTSSHRGAAARYRSDWLPHADWIELDGIGHCPQLDTPLETAQLILGFTAP